MSNERDLASDGYRRTETTCSIDDCDGQLWCDKHTLVCNECSVLIDLDQRRRRLIIPNVMTSDSDSDRYKNSERVRLSGAGESLSDDDGEDEKQDLDVKECYPW